MVTVIIARHSESTWHIAGRLAGQTDEAVLTVKGKKQALEFAKKLEKYHIDSIYSSGLKRSTQTAEIISKYLDKSITKISGFNERSWGKLEGRLNSEIGEELKNRCTFLPPQGESFPDFVERITDSLLDILKQQERKTILIITHGGIKEAFEGLFTPLMWKKLDDIAIITTGVDANVIKRLRKSYN